MGSQEAIHYGVPMIGVPLFADQFINIDNYVRLNIAIKLKVVSLTQEEMDHALNEILNNPKYKYVCFLHFFKVVFDRTLLKLIFTITIQFDLIIRFIIFLLFLHL